MDEFAAIARYFKPLTRGAPEALQLLDDAAVIPARPGFDLVVTKDALVQGVHFLTDDPPDLVARKLLRANLSDLAAKAADPYAYFLAVAWPPDWNEAKREAFARGLGEDQLAFGLTLLGGDTVSTPGPLVVSATMLGWIAAGRMVKRSGARAGDIVLTSGSIGDGWLGLRAAKGQTGLSAQASTYLKERYHLPQPRLALRPVLLALATASADVSDGLIADAGHIGVASGLSLELDLDRLPLSQAAHAWLAGQNDRSSALIQLATGGDDYEIVCTFKPEDVKAAIAQAGAAGVTLTPIGRAIEGQGVVSQIGGRRLTIDKTGWTH